MKIVYLLPFLLGGCSLIPSPGEPPTRYFLDKITSAGDGECTERKRSPKQIAVDIPVVNAPLDINRIAVIPDNNQLDYYANMEWSERLSILIRESLIYSLQDTHFYEGVSRLTDGINPDQILKIDVRKFYILRNKEIYQNKEIDKASACVELYVTLIDSSSRHSLGHKTIEAQIPLKEESKEGISEGLNKANKHVLNDLIDWLKSFC